MSIHSRLLRLFSRLATDGNWRLLGRVSVVLPALFLSACGGDAEHPLARTPQEADAAQSARLTPPPEFARRSSRLSAANKDYAGVDPFVAVEQLMDRVAERWFPSLFPGHKQTQLFAPFLYRYYPETGIYVGVAVNVSVDSPHREGGVYVMGGSFGDTPVYVNQLLEFFTPTQPFPREITFNRIDRPFCCSNLGPEGIFIVRSASAWSNVWSEQAGQGLPPEVEFSTQMILGLNIGVGPSGSYAIAISSVIEHEDRVEVKYSYFDGRGIGGPAAPVALLDFVLVESIDKPIVFTRIDQ